MTNPTTAPPVLTRNAAIVAASMFDAVNGIEGRYSPVHVAPAAPTGASARAAAVQAAYASLLLLYPTATYPSLKSALDARRGASLAVIRSDPGESPASVDAGIAWGQQVAQAIFDWRSTDGFATPPPPFTGGTGVGEWRPTPPAFQPGAVPQFATMTTWVIASPSQFRPAGPPDLGSARYAADFNEIKAMGSLASTSRTADQTVNAYFWASATPSYLFNRLAIRLLAREGRPHSLLRSARLTALLNLAIADAAIATYDAKYHYVFWRPVTAIPLADTDGNDATASDPTWLPMITTPNHPEYPSAHSSLSSAGATVLARFFGDETHFTLDSDTLLGATRSYRSFGAALEGVKDARVFAGIHFRSSCEDGTQLGQTVARYVLAHAISPLDDDGGSH
jgi:membrane-associated phospholipid phosphatase